MTKSIYDKLPNIVKSMYNESDITTYKHAVTLCESMLDSIYGNYEDEEKEIKKEITALKKFIAKYK
jgi:hypothetical protein